MPIPSLALAEWLLQEDVLRRSRFGRKILMFLSLPIGICIAVLVILVPWRRNSDGPQVAVWQPAVAMVGQYPKPVIAQQFPSVLLTRTPRCARAAAGASGDAAPAQSTLQKGADRIALLKATEKYVAATESGLSPMAGVAKALDGTSFYDLSDTKKRYAEKVKLKLEENEKKFSGRTEEAIKFFDKGMCAYHAGEYQEALKFFQLALLSTNPNTIFGGEIQMHRAFVLQARAIHANEKYDEALDIIKKLCLHPAAKVRKEAKNVKFVWEAPELKVDSNKLLFKIPLLEERKVWTKEMEAKPLPEEDYERVFKKFTSNKYALVAGSVAFVGMATWSATVN